MQKLLKNRLVLLALLITVLLSIVAFFVLSKSVPNGVLPPVNSNNVPPVVVNAPELNLVEVNPPAGSRKSIDGFTQTAFKFSASVDVSSLRVDVTPSILLKKIVFPEKPDTLFIEPERAAWQSGVSYTLVIKAGLRGVNGEELKKDIEYTFSNTPIEYIDLKNPI